MDIQRIATAATEPVQRVEPRSDPGNSGEGRQGPPRRRFGQGQDDDPGGPDVLVDLSEEYLSSQIDPVTEPAERPPVRPAPPVSSLNIEA